MELSRIQKYIEDSGFIYESETSELHIPNNFVVIKCRHNDSANKILNIHLSRILTEKTFTIIESHPCKVEYYFYRISDELKDNITNLIEPAYFIKIISGDVIQIRLPWILNEGLTSDIPEWSCIEEDMDNYAFPMIGKGKLNELSTIQVIDSEIIQTDYCELSTDLEIYNADNINKICSYVAYCKECRHSDKDIITVISKLPYIEKYAIEKFGPEGKPASFVGIHYVLETERFRIKKFVESQNIRPVEELWEDMEKGVNKKPFHTPNNSELIVNNNKLLRNIFRNKRNSNNLYIEKFIPELCTYESASILEFTSNQDLINDILESVAVLTYKGHPDEIVAKQMSSIRNKLQKRDPIERYLQNLKWDKVPRLHNWLNKTMGVIESSTDPALPMYIGEVGEALIKSIVFKSLSAQYDIRIIHEIITIFVGIQEAGKTRLAQTLAIDEAYYVTVSTNDKDTGVVYKDCVVADLAEHSNYKDEKIKKLASANKVTQRKFFTQSSEQHRVKSTLIGNSNKAIKVSDAQNRKFCCIQCIKTFNFDFLDKYYPQILAEAVVKFNEEKLKCDQTGKKLMIINISKEAKMVQARFIETDIQRELNKLIKSDVEASKMELEPEYFKVKYIRGTKKIQYIYIRKKERKELYYKLTQIQSSMLLADVDTVLAQIGFEEYISKQAQALIFKFDIEKLNLLLKAMDREEFGEIDVDDD